MPVQRKSMVGLEVEFFVLNDKGASVNKSDDILRSFEKKRLAKYLRPEFSKGMLELGTTPNRSVRDCALAFMENISDLVEKTEKLKLRLLPLGVHPGKDSPILRTGIWYDAKKAVLGIEDAKREGKICGFHFHYTLPEGIVAKDTQMIRGLKRSKAREIFLQQYNFLVAADPAVLTFSQSSPIWDGFYYGKDTRVLVYRDIKLKKGVRELRGLHYYLPRFGALPSYEFTLKDLRVLADVRKAEWLKMLESEIFPTNEIAAYPTLKFMWGPLRVNKIGTFEYRGPDMNHPLHIFSIMSLLRYALEAIEKHEYEVRPSDIGIDEPFVLEDDVIYVPPRATLKHLEYQSVTVGFESDKVHKYASSLFELVSKISKKGKTKNLKLIKKMLKEKKTVSDEIIELVRKNGYSLEGELPKDILNYIALYHAEKFSSEISDTIKMLRKFRD
jgi:hypothetical protein